MSGVIGGLIYFAQRSWRIEDKRLDHLERERLASELRVLGVVQAYCSGRTQGLHGFLMAGAAELTAEELDQARARTAARAGRDPLGPYKLPAGVTATTFLRAVQFGPNRMDERTAMEQLGVTTS